MSSVTVWKLVKLNGRWKYCRPVIAPNHKIIPDMVHVNSHVEQHSEGNYYLHWRQDGKQVWKKIGPKPAKAVVAAEKQEALFNAIKHGLPVQQVESLRRQSRPQ